ncbi:IS3 family transposase [Paenibacillus phyllosphaerae]|uniref:IS3 family transposase n=1 Tax=Paenibacillus phyllosphaerae TaxID=274593 RepID=UPI0033968F0A
MTRTWVYCLIVIIHFYNHVRLQAKLNSLSPMEYRPRPPKIYYLYCLLDGCSSAAQLLLLSLSYRAE